MSRYIRKDDVHVANKAYKERSLFLAVREMDIKTTLQTKQNKTKPHCDITTLGSMAKIIRRANKQSCKDVE